MHHQYASCSLPLVGVGLSRAQWFCHRRGGGGGWDCLPTTIPAEDVERGEHGCLTGRACEFIN